MKIKKFWFIVLVGIVSFLGSIQAQEEDGSAEGEQPEEKSVRRMEVKRYVGVSPRLVSKAITRGLNRDVRFTDTYEGVRRPPQNLRRVTLDGEKYQIAAMVSMGRNLYCLVPEDQEETLSQIRQSGAISEGQKITIEATTLGMAAPGGVLLLDRMIVGEEGESSIDHELVLHWPNAQGVDPIRITEPGEHSVSFPCRYERGEEEIIRLIVRKEDREEFLAKIEEESGDDTEEESEAEGQDDGEVEEKEYREFNARGVYDQIRQNNRLDVQFEDKVKGSPPRVANRIRLPNGRRVRIGTAFDTHIGVTCLIPARKEKMVELVEQAIPGQEVKIWGTTLPSQREYRPMLVDKLDLPGTTEPQTKSNVWDVTLLWDDIDSVRFYKLGNYKLTFPCQHKDEREERLGVKLREVRVISGD